jgi:DNA primase
MVVVNRIEIPRIHFLYQNNEQSNNINNRHKSRDEKLSKEYSDGMKQESLKQNMKQIYSGREKFRAARKV